MTEPPLSYAKERSALQPRALQPRPSGTIEYGQSEMVLVESAFRFSLLFEHDLFRPGFARRSVE